MLGNLEVGVLSTSVVCLEVCKNIALQLKLKFTLLALRCVAVAVEVYIACIALR